MGRRRPRIEPRRVIFVGTEGRSDRSFVQFLQHCCEEAGLRVHLRVEPGSGGGSVAVVRNAARSLKRRFGREDIGAKLVLLDRDRVTQDEQEGHDAQAEATEAHLEIIFQEPNLEGVLLRLHEGHETRPLWASDTKRALRKLWPDYDKSSLTAGSVAPAFRRLRRAARGRTRPAITAAPRNSGALRFFFTWAIARRPLSHDVIPLQRLTSPHGGCLCCPLDSGFRRNDEGGAGMTKGGTGMMTEKQE